MSHTERTAVELLQALSRGDISAEALTGEFLRAIRQREPQVKAFLHVDEAAALEQARAVDARRRQGQPLGPLAGVPVAIKDVLCTAGQPTTCGSKILQNFVPPYDAHVITRLKQADAVLIGKTNMDEFAMGSSTENSAYQTTRNPWDLGRIPGGSSGGSAAAVTACEAPLALGSDTGGSIRQPASLCGIAGMKPTYGRVSRFGLVAYASSLDQVGPFAHDVTDTALLLEVIAGHDPRDSTSVDKPVPAYRRSVDQPVKPLTVGVAREHFSAGLDAEVELRIRAALKVYEQLGAAVKEVSLPHSPYAVAAYYLVATAEASSNLARYDGVHYGHRAKGYENLIDMYSRSRGEGFGSEVKRRIMLGTYALSSGYKDAYYLKALKVRRLIRDDFDKAFAGCDVIVGPTSPTAAFKVGERTEDPLAMYLSDIYTISCNLAGLPGISIPCGFTKSGLPIGLQILAPPFEEEKLLRVARMYERATDWHTRRAPG
ncbi:MAG TPA: Asp-tRNA(Asn)/Glu-tRNA(Gln) amidotransferase subunit GatA [Gemmataceae bacterium]|jgi:aspartyl-tRNA(Asn)/glutamyl-tRNA(Gln) amidotransferase subunit A|nr:Asp-tRNA(Asn)/Glu-tRNA(Gln) amidotransferase subunit GatA [Gemmataceae bacterium]